jgi:hypothetical protein
VPEKSSFIQTLNQTLQTKIYGKKEKIRCPLGIPAVSLCLVGLISDSQLSEWRLFNALLLLHL